MSITVYTKSGFCGMCKATERALDSAGIEYTEVILDDVDQAQIEEWKTTLGTNATNAPNAPNAVTDTETGSWSGFRPDKIGELASSTAA
ncbi:NrdH-redoxin [Curtobacterium flaccumfaciens pv. betae]|uniref:glutaredoxin domain-containing protein n=2 Tax=Curtobacterium flaccumfaciens TaxID=2035 RepID=UPI001BE07F00|nr:glutaredoxin domain-containing protein [Curtobacterium flaccumfaciens]MBT1658500.1 NrdH-redoxin [Curtobacterium flaccumfaciens pv. betae]